MRRAASGLAALAGLATLACQPPRPPPIDPGGVVETPVLAPEASMRTFQLPPGYRVELVAAEPLVQDPVAIDFDAYGRLWVVEMRGYMPDVAATGETAPVGRVIVLHDDDRDGRMDRRTVYMDSLVLPRAIRVLRSGVLVAAPPFLWLTRDTTGDLRADARTVVRDDYGDPRFNPEINASGLAWGMDNWIYSAKYDGRIRLRKGAWEYEPTLNRGQWGASIDDLGRLYRGYNERPLQVDLVAPHYLMRNPNLAGSRGVYEDIVENDSVWPARPTRGVNRGYRETVLREDGRLSTFTASGAPTVYRGDRLPAELRNDVFVTEPAGNLVRRFRVEETEGGSLRAVNALGRTEFLAATDERFRPVNLSSAPDGTLYVVDMYRGLIQHRQYLTDYLRNYILARGLETPVGYGRIYRVVHETTTRDQQPPPEGAAALVSYLGHPNGWWRDHAQRTILESDDRSVVPALGALARNGREAHTRLHALWTLDGLEATDPRLLQQALSDGSPHVRAAAVRLAEPWIRRSAEPLTAAVMGMAGDPSPVVRRQLAASLGELPPAQRSSALLDILRRQGDDPIIADVVVSGLHGLELRFLSSLLGEPASEPLAHATAALAAAVAKAGAAPEIERVVEWAADLSRPRWQRLAMLEGLAAGAGAGRTLSLAREPVSLTGASEAADTGIRAATEDLLGRLDWPGKPRPAPAVAPLSAEEERRFASGRQSYLARCAPCHQAEGTGAPGVAAPLVGSRWVTGLEARLVRILLHGKEGAMLMPPIGSSLPDEEVAAVLTYVRRAWGHQASPVAPEFVREIRGQTTGRTRPWTDSELEDILR